ncbi:MAG: hypothetical protein A3A33_01665 [Candidatus Yanofskybacteria bacterium RIFCSPLOWO2_01_FULL_49_25]|uniref:Uncharacterized protein n=1 Tax=Candidatus Yanofskybacteria bacterium RIFCSPLOWO2_01_FULL_49_25 TaxID=1802701 RepID=A0A1F8GX68_9BACT|nr:MAG: hypothetical protein A3A33_01665 [Candidatus Yanofskybacteria bacterium RIFCSPLOWO2_01_FULL_49_25]
MISHASIYGFLRTIATAVQGDPAILGIMATPTQSPDRPRIALDPVVRSLVQTYKEGIRGIPGLIRLKRFPEPLGEQGRYTIYMNPLDGVRAGKGWVQDGVIQTPIGPEIATHMAVFEGEGRTFGDIVASGIVCHAHLNPSQFSVMTAVKGDGVKMIGFSEVTTRFRGDKDIDMVATEFARPINGIVPLLMRRMNKPFEVMGCPASTAVVLVKVVTEAVSVFVNNPMPHLVSDQGEAGWELASAWPIIRELGGAVRELVSGRMLDYIEFDPDRLYPIMAAPCAENLEHWEAFFKAGIAELPEEVITWLTRS